MPHCVVQRVLELATPGNPQSVLDAVDDFCYNENWMMNVGPVKGAFVDEVIQQAQPLTMLELGTYIGYSTVRWAAQLPPGARLWSIDEDPAAIESADLLLRRARPRNPLHLDS